MTQILSYILQNFMSSEPIKDYNVSQLLLISISQARKMSQKTDLAIYPVSVQPYFSDPLMSQPLPLFVLHVAPAPN